ncbi:hypothetical protein BV25DRAFT_805120 [Artomyces pyxidatus]|uniref:Uncharacterized protein n=1 Tax=Artomyces pyxidatus TaxID=48021 RepID=A0ACB8SZA6_9AGAM|nr:hypothetical protein BV25DRAFT_805120 [Artomyces pyxidatus]
MHAFIVCCRSKAVTTMPCVDIGPPWYRLGMYAFSPMGHSKTQSSSNPQVSAADPCTTRNDHHFILRRGILGRSRARCEAKCLFLKLGQLALVLPQSLSQSDSLHVDLCASRRSLYRVPVLTHIIRSLGLVAREPVYRTFDNVPHPPRMFKTSREGLHDFPLFLRPNGPSTMTATTLGRSHISRKSSTSACPLKLRKVATAWQKTPTIFEFNDRCCCST